MKRKIAIILSFLLLALPFTGCADAQYRECVSLMEQGEYARALDALNALGDYSGAKDLAEECQNAIALENANALLSAGDYVSAREAFTRLASYKNAAEKAEECLLYEDYYIALAYMKAENFPAAASAFSALGDFLDSNELRAEAERAYAYKRAGVRFSLRDYREALTLYREAGDYGNAADMAAMSQKRIMVQTAMQRLISIYRYNASYSLEGVAGLLAGVSGFERADELNKFVSYLIAGDTASAASEYARLTDAYITPALAKTLIERYCEKSTLSNYAALAMSSCEAAASLCDRQRFDAYIASDTRQDENMAAFAAFSAGAADEAAGADEAAASAGGKKFVVYERDFDPVTGKYTGRVLMGAYRMVSAEYIPLDYSEVEYVILIDRGVNVVHTYDSGSAAGSAAGLQETCRVSLVRAGDMKELASFGDFVGGLPPDEYTYMPTGTPTDADAASETDAATDTNANGGAVTNDGAVANGGAVTDTDAATGAGAASPGAVNASPEGESAAATDAGGVSTPTDPIAAALEAYPAYIMGAGPDEKQILSAVRAALIALLEQREGDYGYIVTYGCIGAAGGIPQKESETTLSGITVGGQLDKAVSPVTAGAVLTSYRGSDFVFPRDVGGYGVIGFAASVLEAKAGGAAGGAEGAGGAGGVGDAAAGAGASTNASLAKLTELALPKTLKAIPAGAFLGLGQLKRLKVPASVEYIGENAFPRGAALIVEDNSFAHYWAVANAWPHTVGATASQTDESEPLKRSGAPGTVAYQSVTALAALVPWPEYATPLSESSDGRFLEFGNMDEVRYVLYVRELIASSLFESFDGFTAPSSVPTATLRAAGYAVTVSLNAGVLLVEIAS